MVTNNEAVDNFLNGKRNLAAYQFSQLMRETIASASNSTNNVPSDSASNATATDNALQQQTQVTTDEIASNYAMVNLFTGCPKRASIIFSDLVKRYPRNPRLWLRLAESMLAAEQSKMPEYECIQQLANQNSRDHLIKTKNRPILIKINPNYCQQQKLQHASIKAPPETPANFLASIKGFLQKSLNLINEYNDISLLTDDIPIGANETQHQTQSPSAVQDLLGAISAPTASLSATASTATSTTPTATPTSAVPIDYFSESLTATSKIDSQIQEQQQQVLLQRQRQQQSQAATTSSSSAASGSKLSQQLSYSNPYKSISRSALYHLRIKVHLNLAYICLCMGEPTKALAYTTQCLKSSPQGYEKVLASLYHAEACILTKRIDEAVQFLNLEVLNMAKNLSQDCQLKFGETGRIVYSDEMQHQFDKDTLATVVMYNLSVTCAAKGEFINAQKILMRCISPTRHIPMQLIICLLYVQLQQGQVEAAKKTILSNLPQFR